MDPSIIESLLVAIKAAVSGNRRQDDVTLPIFDPGNNDAGAAAWCDHIETLGTEFVWSGITKMAKAASIIFLPMAFGTLLASVITEKIGRRFVLVMFNVPVTLYWILLYFARNRYGFLAARLIAGFCFGGVLPISYMITAECSSPKIRGFNLTLMTAVLPSVGTFAGNNLGLALSWRTAALIAICPSIVATLIPLFYVESPTWLASKGRFSECEKVFTALHGRKPSAQKELKLILEVEKTKFNKIDKNANTIKLMLQQLRLAIPKKYFWNVMWITITLNIYKMICGKLLFNMFGVQMLQKITGQPDVINYTLIVQGVAIVGSPSIIFLMKYFNVRVLLFPFSLISNALLLALAISLCVQPNYDKGSVLMYTNVSLYGLFMFFVQVLLFPILEALPAEYPSEIRGTCTALLSFISTGFMFVYIWITPNMFALLDYYGAFFANVIVMFLFIVYLWFKLPETKGRTLHGIELYFKNGKFVNIDDIVKGEQMKVLV